MNYDEQLKSPEWKQKRQRIIDRDWGMCQWCMSSEDLQVHHKKYISGRMAWEYDDFDLLTLCGKCHSEHHGIPYVPKVKKANYISAGYNEYHNGKYRSREGTGLVIIRDVFNKLING